jgi:hypothetical protein
MSVQPLQNTITGGGVNGTEVHGDVGPNLMRILSDSGVTLAKRNTK